MERINKGLKLRIYPTQEQEIYLNKNFGCCRFLYNSMLSERINFYNENKDDKEKVYSHKYKTEKDYKEEFEFLKEVDSVALQQSRMHLTTAYKNFFDGLKTGRKVGFPKFKSRHDSSTNRFTVCKTGNNLKIDFEKFEIKIPKCEPIPFKHKEIKKWYKEDTTEIRSMTISKETTGKFFISILFKGDAEHTGEKALITEDTTIGLDMSLQDFYVDNFGNSPEYKRFYREDEAKLKKAMRRLSRKPKDSKNREKQRIKIASLHEKIRNRRKDFVDKLSLQLVQRYNLIVVENLSIKGMSQALRLGKSVMDLGYSSFVEKLLYKAQWNDKTVLLADKWFASSKTCNQCGYVNKDLKLGDRTWTCPKCKTHLERDKNAAINLQSLGIDLLRLGRSEVTPMEFKTSGKGKQPFLSLNKEVGKNVSDNRSHQFKTGGEVHEDFAIGKSDKPAKLVEKTARISPTKGKKKGQKG